MQTIELQVKAKHFIGTRFMYSCDCAISKAAKEYFNTDYVSEEVHLLRIGSLRYKHNDYTGVEFDNDKLTAEESPNPDTVIRTITLTKV